MKLFIPGPTHVRPEILAAQAAPMISHRGEAMQELLAAVLPGVREAFGTRGDVIVLSCSTTGAMEAISRSLLGGGARALHLLNGNFSTLWSQLSKNCGFDVITEERPWGAGYDEATVSATLAGLDERPDVVFVTHCATSTGALSDIAGVVRAVRAVAPDALVCADVTSSAAGVPIDFDAIDLDIAVGGAQKAWALPPALTLAALSPRAAARMQGNPNRGQAHDLVAALAYQNDTGMTMTTPSIPVIQALRRQIDDIHAAGGFAARFERHRTMQQLVLDWVAARRLTTLADPAFRSPTVTSIACGGRFVIADLLAGYREAGFFVGGGYGKTQATHWRIGHMGDHTPEDVEELLAVTDTILTRVGSAPAT